MGLHFLTVDASCIQWFGSLLPFLKDVPDPVRRSFLTARSATRNTEGYGLFLSLLVFIFPFFFSAFFSLTTCFGNANGGAPGGEKTRASFYRVVIVPVPLGAFRVPFPTFPAAMAF